MNFGTRASGCLLGCALALSSPCGGEAREFEDRFGRLLEAELVAHGGVGAKTVMIKKADGKTHDVEIGAFSEKDQTFIREWMKKTKPDSFPRFPSLADGLLVRYSFEGTVGTVVIDESGTGINGKLASKPSMDAGVIGQAMTFDGATEHMAIDGGVTEGRKWFSVAFWLKTKESRSGTKPWYCPSLIAQDNSSPAGGDLGIFTDEGEIGFWHGLSKTGKIYRSKNRVNDGEWHHVALASDSKRGMRLFLDGRAVASGIVASKPLNSTAFAVGGQMDTQGRIRHRHKCAIDELMVWDRAISDAEVTALHLLRYRKTK